MTDADIAVILRRLDEQDKSLDRIEGKVDKTNGRVTRLETDKRVAEAVVGDHKRDLDVRKAWAIGIFSAAVTGAVGSIVLILAGGHP
jgi:tetrahydromethanopterin S-methyltransferase subunit G